MTRILHEIACILTGFMVLLAILCAVSAIPLLLGAGGESPSGSIR